MIRAAVASGYGAAVAKACSRPFPDCSRCRHPSAKQLRVMWGCDEEADRPVWESTCPRCGGADEACERCQGSNEVVHYRCPSSMVRESSSHTRMQLDLLLRAYSHYSRHHVMPSSGAWLDQSRSFIAGVDAVDNERAYWDNLRLEHEQKEIERSKKQSQQSRMPRRR